MTMTLDQIRAHKLYPFADFRTNDVSYLMLELFWTTFVQEILGAELIEDVQVLQDFDRDIHRDYDPVMIDFWIPRMRRGSRVLLLENHENLPLCETVSGDDRFNCYHGFGYHSSRRGITGPNDEIDQAVFRSDMSEQALSLTRSGIYSFMVERVGFDVLDTGFKEYCLGTNAPSEQEWEAYYAQFDEEDGQ